MTAYVQGSLIDSDTLLICKMSGTHGRLDLTFGFSSEFSVLSLPKHKIYFQLRHVINKKAEIFLSKEVSISVVTSSLRMTRLLLKVDLTRSEHLTKEGRYLS